MPHQCTNCGRTFDDGSKQMLAGCPDCGGNKFQFLPQGFVEGEGPGKPLEAAAGGDDDIIEAPPEPVEGTPTGEDRAQATARSSVVSDEELPPVESRYGAEQPSAPAEEAESEPPDLAKLREELNEQFESIKILQPGEYELNLMELYDREEYIIALEEDGRYVIEVPDSWPDQ